MRERLGPIYQVFKTAIGAGLAWVLAQRFLHIPAPFFAPLAVVLVLQATIADTVQRAINRIIGVGAGVAISVLMLQWIRTLNAFTIGLVLLVSMLIPTLMRINPFIIMQVGVTAVMVVVMHGTGIFAVQRVVETVLGVIVAIVVNALIIPPDLDPAAERRVLALAQTLGDDLVTVSQEPKAKAQEMMPARGKAIEGALNAARDALRLARQSIKYNPFLGARAKRLEPLERVVPELELIAVQVGGILHGLNDLGTAGHPAVDGLGAALRETGEAVIGLGRVLADGSPESRAALKQELEQARDSQCHCLSQLKQLGPVAAVRENGAILTDLARISTEVEAAMALVAGRSVRPVGADEELAEGPGPVVRT